MNTLRVLILYVVCLFVGQAVAVALGIFADRYSSTAGIAVFIPAYYAMYWIAWRLALWIGDRNPEPASSSGRPPLSTAVWLAAPATLALDLAD